jgi:hypothetical protein
MCIPGLRLLWGAGMSLARVWSIMA